jgi:beta-mannosidase
MRSLPLARASWQFRDMATKRWLPATVPGCVHTDLRAAGQIPDPFFGTNELALQWIETRDWEYRTAFTVSAALAGEDVIELVADGLDTVATITLNDRVVAQTDNMFVGHRWPVKELIRTGRNVLGIRFRSALDYIRTTRQDFTPPREFNDPVGGCVRIRKQQSQFGWDWGPRFVTAGIWRDLRLEAWSGNRLVDLEIRQHHAAGGAVSLAVTAELARPDRSAVVTAALSLAGRPVASIDFAATTAGKLAVPAPQLWWPAGQGAQPLYHLAVTVRDRSGRTLGPLKRRIGLRTLRLDRSPDRWGESFRFVVNGRPVFLKGANWIPAHSFVAGLTRRRYDRDLRAAAAVHMNAVRVWGGGIYESEPFYDLCDELGLLVWQDFMFACTLYPADRDFLASVRSEVAFQARRLRHRACLALWCGNNELPMLNPGLRQATLRRGYEKLFHRVIPATLARHDPVTPYWPSSPWRGAIEAAGHDAGERSGDTHYWDVWHARHPVKDYEKWSFRFVSEFGMQSYSSPATNTTCCPPDDRNVFGPAMENHQKNRAGNQIILDYISRRYRRPRTQAGLIYLSQLNQAYCMQVGVEHYRRLMPRCMGALYWQLNDCWPAASWSSIEFTGRWKALHYAARRFFAPALGTVYIPGDEQTTIGNYRHSTVGEAQLYTVCDPPAATSGLLRWELRRFDGRRVLSGRRRVRLMPGISVRQHTLDLRPFMAKHGREHLYLHLVLEPVGLPPSEQTVFLSPPRFLALPRGRPQVTVHAVSPTEFAVSLRSSVFLHAVELDLPGLAHALSDNYFDLHPGVTKIVRLSVRKKTTVRVVRARLRHQSLVDVCG